MVTLLSLGGGPLGGLFTSIPDSQACDVAHAAYTAGIRYFDTAPFYGHGLSEHRLGAVLRGVPRDSFVLSSKVGRLMTPGAPPNGSGPFVDVLPFTPVFDYSYEGTLRSFEDTLQRLGMDRIDVLLIHDVSPTWHGEAMEPRFREAMDGAYRALAELRSQGVVKAIGVAVNDAGICVRFASAGDFDCFLLAARYTLLVQDALDELLSLCLRQNIGVIAAAPFHSGILATGAVDGAMYAYRPATRDVIERTRRLEAVCARHGVPVAAAALQFALGHPTVSSVLVGCRSVDEVQRNLALFEHAIGSAFWSDLKAEALIRADAPVPSE